MMYRSRLVRAACVTAAFMLGFGIAPRAQMAAARADDTTQLRGGTGRSGAYDEKIVPPLSLLWRFTGASQSFNPSSPAVVGDTVYFSTGGVRTGGGTFYALDTATGAEKWRFTLPGGEGIFTTAPLVSGGLIYVGASDGRLYVLNAGTGQQERSFKTGGPINSSPAIENGILYFGSNDGTFYALDATTGSSPWRQLYRTSDAVDSAPVIADGNIYFTTSDQYIHAIKQATGIFRWKLRVDYRSDPNSLVYADNTLYLPAGPRLNAFQSTSGRLRWSRGFGNNLATAPVANGGIVYVIDSERNMYAVRSNNGKDAWEKPAVLPFAASAAPTLSGDVIYIPTNRNTILAVSREDGHILWQYATTPVSGNSQYAAPAFTSFTAPIALANGAIYTVSDDGSLAAFRPDATDTSAPIIDRFFPRTGQSVSGQPPLTIAANVSDYGSGIDPSTIKLSLDDRPVVATYDGSQGLVIYQTSSTGKIVDPPIPNGRHTATLNVKDWRGNEAESTWSFVVDNSLKPLTSREVPTPPRAAKAPRPTLTAPRPRTPAAARPRIGLGAPRP